MISGIFFFEELQLLFFNVRMSGTSVHRVMRIVRIAPGFNVC